MYSVFSSLNHGTHKTVEYNDDINHKSCKFDHFILVINQIDFSVDGILTPVKWVYVHCTLYSVPGRLAFFTRLLKNTT